MKKNQRKEQNTEEAMRTLENTFTRVRGGWVGEGAGIIPREMVSNLIHE